MENFNGHENKRSGTVHNYCTGGTWIRTMKYTDEQISKVRDISIAEALGVRLNGRKIMIKCPHPNHRDSSPSFQLRPDNSYYCFGCGEGGFGWISFCKFMGHGFKAVMEEYGEL